MTIAVPTSNGVLCPHFGHCEEFTLINVDEASQTIQNSCRVPAPAHQPGELPGWLVGQGTDVVLAGGMGAHAVDLLNRAGITVHTGVPQEAPVRLVQAFLGGSLQLTENSCDHPEEGQVGGQCGRR